MPFSCKATILKGQLRGEDLIIDSWVDEVWFKYVKAGTIFAKAHDSKGPCVRRLTGPGYLSSKPTMKTGDRISEGSVVAHFSADGEAIPYGRPYCTIEFEPE
jgi:hypothetical protein